MTKWRIQIQIQLQIQIQNQVLPEDNNIFEECEEDKDDASAHPDVQG